jgi:hypothetical protein
MEALAISDPDVGGFMPAHITPSRRPLPVLVAILLAATLLLCGPLTGSAQTSASTEATAGRVRIVVDSGLPVDAPTIADTYGSAITGAWPQFTALFATEPRAQQQIRFVEALTPESLAGMRWVHNTAWVAPDGLTAIIAVQPFLELTPVEAGNILRNITSRAFIQSAGGDQVPAGLADGIARYVEIPVVATQARLGSLVQGLDQSGTLPAWATIAASEPITLSAEVRTANAYALVAFLTDRYGVAGLQKFVTGFASNPDLEANLTASVSQSTADLSATWTTYLPRWFASGWRDNAVSAFDLSRSEELFERGAYEAASAEAERSQRLFTDLGDQTGLARVEALLAQCAVGLQADGIMLNAEGALTEHDYQAALTLVNQADDLYLVLPESHRPGTTIERYRTLATTGIEATAYLQSAQHSADNWLQLASSRSDAVKAGDAFATLGDVEGHTAADEVVSRIDLRLWRMAYIVSALVIALGGWLVAWSWLKRPSRLNWASRAAFCRNPAGGD